jgi:hypothetical protein
MLVEEEALATCVRMLLLLLLLSIEYRRQIAAPTHGRINRKTEIVDISRVSDARMQQLRRESAFDMR